MLLLKTVILVRLMSEAESHKAPFLAHEFSLFNLFIDDIADVCCGTVKHSLYADDLKIFSQITIIRG